MTAPPDGHRDGRTYDPTLDYARLNRQARAVFHVMSDGHWHTLAEIAQATNEPEASVSARLRDLRKAAFGSWTVERHRSPLETGLHFYRLIPGSSDQQRGTDE